MNDRRRVAWKRVAQQTDTRYRRYCQQKSHGIRNVFTRNEIEVSNEIDRITLFPTARRISAVENWICKIYQEGLFIVYFFL